MTHRDAGASNERTALAWQRTALCLLATSALITRLTLDRWGVWSIVSVTTGGALALPVFWESRGRRLPHGRSPFALTVATVVLAVAVLTTVVAARRW